MDTAQSYHVRAKSTKTRSGEVASESVREPIQFSAPPEFLGESGVCKFVGVKLRPALKIAREIDRERANRLFEKAEKGCLVARSIFAEVTLKTSVSIVPEIAVVTPVG